MITDNEIFLQAQEVYGTDEQVRHAMEELAELSVALNHRLRGKCQNAEVIKEIADVKLMIDQMERLFRLPHDRLRQMDIQVRADAESVLFNALKARRE